MSLPGWLRAVLPGDTASTWETIRGTVPASSYLVGGTAIAVHLRHRVSRDLDFFLAEPGYWRRRQPEITRALRRS